MLDIEKFITINSPVTCLATGDVAELSNEDYRLYARDTLLFVDHHDSLNFDPVGCSIATSREQLDILIEELESLRPKLKPAANR